MNGVLVATAIEARKASAAPVVRTATVLLVIGITVLISSFTLAARAGNEQVLAQLGPLSEFAGWELYLGLSAQVTGAASVLGFGVTLSWIVGREFADGTISALFGLPISRAQLCGAKLLIYAVWASGLAIVLTAVLGGVGLAIGLGPMTGETVSALGRQLVLVVLSAGLATPAAWAATLGRGLLPGIAATIAVVVVAQVGVVAGAGAWLPLAAPAFWALEPDAVSPLQVTLSLTVPVAFSALALLAWSRLQLDR